MTETHVTATDDRAQQALANLHRAAALFTVAVLVHNFDHLRRGGDSVSTDVFWIGTSAIVIEVALVALVVMRHRIAALAATVFGFALAVGYAVVHFTPERGWLSDSFVSGDASLLSIFAATFEALAATALGIAGLQVLRQRGGLASAARVSEGDAEDPDVRAAFRHPLVVAMVLGNLIVVIGSFATM